MGRLVRGLQLSLRRRLERSKPFAKPRLAELPTDERSFRPNAPHHILEYKTVAMQPNDDTQTAAGFVYVVPPS
jgi:hypothetical protein